MFGLGIVHLRIPHLHLLHSARSVRLRGSAIDVRAGPGADRVEHSAKNFLPQGPFSASRTLLLQNEPAQTAMGRTGR